MTDQQDSGSDFNDRMTQAGDAGSEDHLPMPEISAEDDQWVTSMLSRLEDQPMPDWVQTRVFDALSAESTLRSAQTTAIPGTSDLTEASAPAVVSLDAHRRSRGGRWFVAVAGVAAAGVIGLVVGKDLFTDNGGSPPTAAAAMVPMSASTVHYEQQDLMNQASEQLPAWRSAAASASATASEPAISALPTASETATAEPTPDDSATSSRSTPSSTSATEVPMTTRVAITACLPAVSQRSPFHVEFAVYREPDATTEEPVALVAVPADDRAVDVYVMGLGCTAEDPQIRAHIRVPEGR